MIRRRPAYFLRPAVAVLALTLAAACGGSSHDASQAPPPARAPDPAAGLRPSESSRDPALEGTWRGTWVRDGSALPVTIRFSRGSSGYEGTFDSDALRVVGIPFSDIAFTPPQASWRLVGDTTTSVFEGSLDEPGQRLIGRFRDGEASGEFALERVASPPPHARREEVTFRNEEVTLTGTVFVGAGEGPHPGIVFLHGSGPEGRWASFFLAERFAARGFVALAFDKRGVGGSGGSWRAATLEDLAGDAAAGAAALAARPDVARDRIGIHGHSQGGTLAPRAAERIGTPAFVIASAAAAGPMRAVEIYSIENSLGISRMAPAEAAEARAFVEAVVATAYDGAPREHMLAAWNRVRSRPWAFEPPPADDSYWAFSRIFTRYDAESHWRKVTAPALLLYGGADARVPPRPSAARIADAYLGGRGTSFEVMFFPDADHTFRLRPAGDRFAWPATAPGYPERMIDWAVARVERPASVEAASSTSR